MNNNLEHLLTVINWSQNCPVPRYYVIEEGYADLNSASDIVSVRNLELNPQMSYTETCFSIVELSNYPVDQGKDVAVSVTGVKDWVEARGIGALGSLMLYFVECTSYPVLIWMDYDTIKKAAINYPNFWHYKNGAFYLTQE